MRPAPVETPPAIPRWVWAFGIIAAVLVAAFLILHLLGRAPSVHGP